MYVRCNYVLILVPEFLSEEQELIVADIVNICNKENKEFQIVTEKYNNVLWELIQKVGMADKEAN